MSDNNKQSEREQAIEGFSQAIKPYLVSHNEILLTIGGGENALKAIADWHLTHLEAAKRKAEARTRHEIASQAPECEHDFDYEKEHKAYCGFINGIWTNWAVKNGANIDHNTGKANLSPIKQEEG